MNITDELKVCIKKWGHFLGSDNGKAELFAIADRIDAEHEKALDEQFKALTTDMEPMTEENMAEHGWVRGPLDADGVMWREGDMSDSVWGEIELIVRDVDGHWYIKGHDTSAPWVRADSKRHHHKPTVEGVLKEMCDALNDARMPLGSGMISEEIIAEYATKLQLRSVEE